MSERLTAGAPLVELTEGIFGTPELEQMMVAFALIQEGGDRGNWLLENPQIAKLVEEIQREREEWKKSREDSL